MHNEGGVKTENPDDELDYKPHIQIKSEDDRIPFDDSACAATKHPCPLCSVCFSSRAHLHQHYTLHHGGYQPYGCHQCRRRFRDRRTLRRHVAIVHNGVELPRSQPCPQCTKTFVDQSTLKTHLLIHSATRPYQCDECPRAFRQPNNLRVHKRIHTGETPFCCDECGRLFRFHSAYKQHTLAHHPRDTPTTYACDECGRQFGHVKSLNGHFRLHTGERPYVCDDCGRSFTHQRQVDTHSCMGRVRDQESDEQKCWQMVGGVSGAATAKILWGAEGALIDTVKLEMRLTTPKSPGSVDSPYPEMTHPCPACSVCFSARELLKKHYSRHHGGHRPYGCQQCRRRFKEQRTLRRHVDTKHHGVVPPRPEQCPHCPKSFVDVSSLKTHLTVHSTARPYQCDDCAQTFSRPINLRHHQRVHTGETPFACDECGRMFRFYSAYRQHTLAHHPRDAPTTYACDECGRQFSHVKSLNGHFRLHTGERPFTCDDCGRSFIDPRQVDRHWKEGGVHCQGSDAQKRWRITGGRNDGGMGRKLYRNTKRKPCPVKEEKWRSEIGTDWNSIDQAIFNVLGIMKTDSVLEV